MKAKYAARIRFAIRMARWSYNAVGDDPRWYADRAAQVHFPVENPFCRLEHFAFARTYRKLQSKARA